MRILKSLPMLIAFWIITMLTSVCVAGAFPDGEAKNTALSSPIQINLTNTVSQSNSNPPNDRPSGTIKIGGNFELTGAVASFGKSAVNGARLAIKQVNNSGGVLGRQIEFVVMDNFSQPSESANVMTTLVLREKVAAIIGAVTSSDTLAAALIAEHSRVPIISPTSTNPRVTVDGGRVKRYVFRTAFIDPYQGKIMGEFAAKSLSAKTAALIIDNSSAYSKAVTLEFITTFLSNNGRIVAQEMYLQKDQDFRILLKRVQNANPDIIFIPGYYSEAGLLIRQAREMGITAPLLGADGWDSPRLVEYAGAEALNNTYFSHHYSAHDSTPANKRFMAAYQEEYSMEPDAISACGYDAAMILIEAIKQADSADPEQIRDALEKVEITGATGKISFDVFHDPKKKPGIVIRMVNGKQTFFQRITPR